MALLLALSSSAFGQTVNYVSNGGFETYKKCPNSVDQIRLAQGWSPIDTLTLDANNGGNPNCSAEYCDTCAPASNYRCSIPLNQCGYQYPHSGGGMASMFMYTDVDTSYYSDYYLRDYIQNRLIQKLIAGKRYCVSFYVNLAEISGYAIKEIGAYFDNGSIDAAQFCGIPQTQCIPQITNSKGIIIDTAGWTKIEGSFVAAGNEQFITIGNFKDKLTTTYVTVPPNNFNTSSHTSYYRVDDVSVVESTVVADAGPDTHVGTGGSVYIGRPMSEAVWCDWRVLGSSTIIGQGPGIWVNPTVTTRYEVTQNLCGNVTKDTVRVEVWAAGVTTINGRTQNYILAPNPSDGNIQLQQLEEDKRPVRVKVYNIVGVVVHSSGQLFEGKSASLNLSGLTPGVYYMVLRDATGTAYTLQFVKK